MGLRIVNAFRQGGWGTVAALMTNGIAVTMGMIFAATTSPAGAVSDWLFPSDSQMRDLIGVRTDRYEFPPRNTMDSANGYRNTKCAPRYARQAVDVGSWSYNLMSGPRDGSVNITIWKFTGAGVAARAVNNTRRQMKSCKSYRLYLKNDANDSGFAIKTSGVNGGNGQVRMRNKFAAVVKSAEREWLTAVDRYVVQVEVTWWGRKRPPFPPASINRVVTDEMEYQLAN